MRRKVLIAITIVFTLLLLSRVLVRQASTIEFSGEQGDPARIWSYEHDATEPCWLRVRREHNSVIRVNCFAIGGVLHTHSNRFAPVASLLDRSWTQVVDTTPELEVLIDDEIYRFKAIRIQSEAKRRDILKARHYRYIPDGIQIYALAE